jgi:hypothetical protein
MIIQCMPSWYHSCSNEMQEAYASPLAKSTWGELKRGSDGQKMDHRILLPGDSAEHRNRSTFVLYHLNPVINYLKYLTFQEIPTIITLISSYFNVLELSRVDALPAPGKRYYLLPGATILGPESSEGRAPSRIA